RAAPSPRYNRGRGILSPGRGFLDFSTALKNSLASRRWLDYKCLIAPARKQVRLQPDSIGFPVRLKPDLRGTRTRVAGLRSVASGLNAENRPVGKLLAFARPFRVLVLLAER